MQRVLTETDSAPDASSQRSRQRSDDDGANGDDTTLAFDGLMKVSADEAGGDPVRPDPAASGASCAEAAVSLARSRCVSDPRAADDPRACRRMRAAQARATSPLQERRRELRRAPRRAACAAPKPAGPVRSDRPIGRSRPNTTTSLVRDLLVRRRCASKLRDAAIGEQRQLAQVVEHVRHLGSVRRRQLRLARRRGRILREVKEIRLLTLLRLEVRV